MIHALLIAIGGALGALLRAGAGALAARVLGAPFWGTLLVNLLGCLLIGAGRAAVELQDWGSPQARAFVFVGLLGAFTTFSTFELDAFVLWHQGQRLHAALYLGGSVTGGLAMVALGWWLVGLVARHLGT